MSKIRFYNTTDYSYNQTAVSLSAGVPLQYVDNQDQNVFFANDTYDLTLLKKGVYKIKYSVNFLKYYSSSAVYFHDTYGRRIAYFDPPIGTTVKREYTQTINNDSLIPNQKRLFQVNFYRAEYITSADSYIEIEYLGEGVDVATTVPPYLKTYQTIIEFLPNCYPVGMGVTSSSLYTPRSPYTVPEFNIRKDLLGLNNSSVPYVYFIKQTGDYTIDVNIDVENSDYYSTKSLPITFIMYVNKKIVFEKTELAITAEEKRNISANFTLQLNEGDNFTFYCDDGASNSKIDPTLLSITKGWIGIKPKATAPQGDIKIGGINKMQHNPNDIAFEINKVNFKKVANSSELEEEYSSGLFRQILYRDIYQATVKEEKKETTLTLLIKNENIFKRFLNRTYNNFEVVFYLKDTSNRERQVLCFIEKFTEVHNDNGNYIELVATQKQKILNAQVSSNQNHVIGTTEADLQVSSQSSTDFIYPETWNLYKNEGFHFSIIESLINRNLINTFKIKNGEQGELDTSRKLVGLNGVDFTNIDAEEVEIDFEIEQGKTIEEALTTIYDIIGYEMHWELLKSTNGFYINFFMPSTITFNFDETLRFVDSYTFSRDYTKVSLVTVIGSGFNEGYAEQVALNNRTMRPQEIYLDEKDNVKNSTNRAKATARRNLPKTSDIYTGTIAFKSGASISHYDLKAGTILSITKDGIAYDYTITGITTTIDSNGINFIYDMQQGEEN